MALWQSEYPFGSHYLTIGANRLHYVDERRGDQPIVCVHGNPTGRFTIARSLNIFATRNVLSQSIVSVAA
jgi:pimeloyl-ACP methyl ester carboxylesterase